MMFGAFRPERLSQKIPLQILHQLELLGCMSLDFVHNLEQGANALKAFVILSRNRDRQLPEEIRRYMLNDESSGIGIESWVM